MSELFSLILALVVGMGLGVFYFGGLWLTIRQLSTTRRPALLTLGSFLGRMGVILVGFYFIMAGQWERLIVCLVGFFGMRNLLVHRWQPEHKPPSQKRGSRL